MEDQDQKITKPDQIIAVPEPIIEDPDMPVWIVYRPEVHIQKVAVRAWTEEEARLNVANEDDCVELENPDGTKACRYKDTLSDGEFDVETWDAAEATIPAERREAMRQLFDGELDDDEIDEINDRLTEKAAARYAADPKNPKNWSKS